MSLYKVIQVVGTSEVSWEDATKHAIDTARETLTDLRVAEVTRMDVKIEDGKMIFRAKIDLSFRYSGVD